jgi:hypothetical protein
LHAARFAAPLGNSILIESSQYIRTAPVGHASLTTVNLFIADGRIDDSNTANGLLASLKDAQDAIDKGKNNVAVNKLREFIDQVKVRAERSIALDAAQLLVTDAQCVIATLQ